uniref:Predicted gene, 21903 n=1 Tax=Mus musculus TaxID=10090 RepID=J3QMQ1_MOUSE
SFFLVMVFLIRLFMQSFPTECWVLTNTQKE